jgi:hypothetical protein
MSRAKWSAMDWYNISMFVLALGTFLTLQRLYCCRIFRGRVSHLLPLSRWGQLLFNCDYSPLRSAP